MVDQLADGVKMVDWTRAMVDQLAVDWTRGHKTMVDQLADGVKIVAWTRGHKTMVDHRMENRLVVQLAKVP